MDSEILQDLVTSSSCQTFRIKTEKMDSDILQDLVSHFRFL